MASQGKPVLISLQASASAEGDDPEMISLITTGELSKTSRGYSLRYEESLDESVSPTQVELTLEENSVTMRRSGEYDVNMVFHQGQRYEGQYHTPYGCMDLALFCTKAAYAVNPQDGQLHLQYQLDINGQFMALHNLNLSFSRKEAKAP